MSSKKLKIEKGVPLPLGINRKSVRASLYEAFERMSPGESVLWSEEGLTPYVLARRVSVTLGQRFGSGTFAIRQEGDGVRVWKR